MKYIVDTNILLDFINIIEEKNDLVIATNVLRELDGLKLNANYETAFKARRAAVMISKNLDKIEFNDSLENVKKPVDDLLLDLTQLYNGELITNDVYLKVKAKIRGLKTSGYGLKSDYTGAVYWMPKLDENLFNQELSDIYETGSIPEGIELYENQYLIVQNEKEKIINKNGNETYKTLDVFVYQHGELSPVNLKTIKNKYINEIAPKNVEQKCLFNILNNRDISIVYAGGGFGRGKSFILNNFALQELEKGKIAKIVYVPNNAYTANTMEIGALPG